MSAKETLQIAVLKGWIRTLAMRARKRYRHRLKLDLADLCQAGTVGAMKALPGWNPELGAWVTYVTPWVEEYIRQEIEFNLLKGMRKKASYRRDYVIPGVSHSELVLNAVPGSSEAIKRLEQRQQVMRILAAAKLSDKELLVVEQCELHERTLQDVGDELGVTRERVRQIREGALVKMQRAARSEAP